MKGFNRKRLVSSLAASAIIAAATFAPLPSFLAPVHAAPATPYVQVNNPAKIDESGGTGSNSINVTLTYNCPVGSAAANVSVAVTQTAAQSGSGEGATGSTGGTPGGTPVGILTCDGAVHQVNATVFPSSATFFNAGLASVTATLIDGAGATVATSGAVVVRVV